MSKEFILSESGNDYKANLHSHTNMSDGNMTPQEVKECYNRAGYSVIAYTDHDVFVPHPELCDESFLALNGFEAEFNQISKNPKRKRRTTHLCMIALDQNTVNQPCFHREKYYWGNGVESVKLVKYDKNEPDFEREYTAENINLFIKKCREQGFFVTYNHPAWSLETFADYGGYEGMNAIEILNGDCIAEGFPDYNHRDYEAFLRQGKRIFAVAGDDNHSMRGTFCAWTVIRAEKLTYKDICDSLLNGNFYSSNGPEIKSLYIEDGVIYAKTSEAASIIFNTAIRHTKRVKNDDGTPVTSGSFKIDYNEDEYVRVTVVGFDGTVAFSNAYFINKE